MNLTPLKRDDIKLGSPLPWCIYDSEGNLLLDDGVVIESEDQLSFLFRQELFREASAPKPAHTSPPEPPRPAATSAPAQPARPTTQAEPAPAQARRSPASARPAPHVSNGKADVTHFEDMKLQPGERLQLQLVSDPRQERHYAKYIGYAKDQSVLIKTPLINGLPLTCNEGEEIIVRAFSGQAAYAFTSSVLRVITMPYHYFHLTYPPSVQGLIIRKSTRVKINLAADVKPQGTAEGSPALIINLSVNGAMLDAERELGKKGDHVDMTFTIRINDFESNLNLQAAIRSVGKNSSYAANVEAIHYGLEFVNVQPFDKVLLQTLVYQQLMNNPQAVA